MKRKISNEEIEKDLAVLREALKTVKKSTSVEKALNNIIEHVKVQEDEFRKPEEELKQAKFFTNLIIDSSTLPIIITDRNWKWIKVNPAFEDLFGYKVEEVLGKSNYELPIWTPEEYKRCSNIITPLLEKEGLGKPVELETLCKTKDGRDLNILLKEVFLEEGVSKEIGFIGYLLDMTELRKREAELKDVISTFGLVLSRASEGDLLVRVEPSSISEEYRPIGDSINSMIASFNRMIDTIKRVSEGVTNKAERMATTSEETTISIQEIAESVKVVAKEAAKQSAAAMNQATVAEEIIEDMKAVAKEAAKQSTAALNQATAAEETESALEEQTRSSEELSTIGQELLNLSEDLLDALKPLKVKPIKQK
jgi:PAS domain S-box-containing protein